MKKRQTLKHFLSAVLIALVVPCTQAATNAPNLIDIFNQSLASDPQWQTYQSTLLSQKENLPIARALLLPLVAISGSTQYNIRNNRAPIPFSILPNYDKGVFDYTGNNYAINLTQPILNFAYWEGFQAAKANVKQATAIYGAEYQALMIQVAQAYFNVLEAHDVVDYTISERQSVTQMYKQNIERYRVGLGTITDVYNAEAQLDNIISTEIGAKTNLLNALEALRAITGQTYTQLAGLKNNIPLKKPNPQNVEDWVAISLKQNLTILGNRYAVDAAKEVILEQFGGNIPTVNAIVSNTELYSGNVGTGKVNENDTAAGLQIAIPIYSGGAVVANTNQAQFNYQTALSNLEQSQRSTAESARQYYNDVVSGANQIKSDLEAIRSNSSSLESTIAAFKVGTRTMTDVLQVQTQLFNTQVAYANDLYSYLINILNLKNAAGTLSPQDLMAINLWLTSTARLSGYYETPYTESVPNFTPPKQLSPPAITPSPNVQNLPVFTAQPQSQWTTPSTSTLPSGALNTPTNGPVVAPDPES